jgi:hypothetical protein
VFFEEFANDIRRTVSEAKARQFSLRSMGGAAIRIRWSNHKQLFERVKRDAKREMDFVAYTKFRTPTKKTALEEV